MSSNPLVRPKRPTGISSPLRRTPVSKREFIQNPNALDNRGSRGGSLLSGTATTGEAASSSSSAAGSSSSSGAPAGTASKNTPAGPTYTDFTLRACKYEEVKDYRHHIMKFHSRSKVDPAKQFTPPIRFHRKDPRNLQFQLTISEMEERANAEAAANAEGSAPAEGEAAGDKPDKPQADMSLVAPEGGARRQRMPFQRKTRQVQAGDEASRKLRYEEYYPWIMEDFDGKNTWVGNYEAAQSDTYCLFVFDSDGFKMVPAEKWYKMTPRNKFVTLSVEEAEQRMEKKQNAPRWIMRKLGIEQQKSGSNDTINTRRKFKTVEGSIEGRIKANGGGGARVRGDEDELDYDEEFADDEEAPIMEGAEEDVKEVEEKLKKERRGAHFGAPDENQAENDFEDRRIDKEGRKLKKYLKSLEKNTHYDSDEDENPYASEEESESESDHTPIKKETTENKSNSSKSALDLQAAAAAAALQQQIAKKAIVKKEYKNLSPGMAIIQLPPNKLAKFPQGVWNPNAKRKRPETLVESAPVKSKKLKVKQPSPGLPSSSGSAGAGPGPSPDASSSDSGMLTEERVRSLLSSKRMKTDELLSILKPDLKRHPKNAEKLKAILRKIAKLNKGILLLKDEDKTE